MKLKELIELLKTTGLSVAYHHFHEPPDLPFITVVENTPDVLLADNTHFHTHKNYSVNYYFERKDPGKEEELETLLLSNGLIFDVTEDIYISTEQLYLKTYEVN